MINVYTQSLSRDYGFAAHRDGCKDITKYVREHGAHVIYTANSIAEAESKWDDDGDADDLGWTWDDVHIFTCCYSRK